MTFSENLEELTGTFSADRAFCDHLFSSENAENAARILVFYKWARLFLPHFQEGLLNIAPKHFPPTDIKTAEFWTATLTAGILKDIYLIPYLVVRGVLSEAGSVLRRTLEHTGVLTHFWYDPTKAAALQCNPDSRDFKEAFERERDKITQDALKAKGIKKRFASFSSTGGVAATLLYKILSQYDVHGGTPANLLSASLGPTKLSCGFVNRAVEDESRQIEVIGNGCGIVCLEIAYIHAAYGKKYGVTPPEVGEGGRLLFELISPDEMKNYIQDMLAQLRGEVTELQKEKG
jgi:hypothetical protein